MLRMRAYYYGFSTTTIEAIDLLLCAVAAAGKLFHHTDQWTSEIDYQVENVRGKSPVDWIQNAADDAAETYKRLIAERDTLRAENAELRKQNEFILSRFPQDGDLGMIITTTGNKKP